MVNPTRKSNAADELAALYGAERFVMASGYDTEGDTTDALVDEAVKAAASSDIAIVFAGLPDSYESEGFDRRSIAMPPGHVRLIEAVAEKQSNVVVVLLNGSAIEMPWAPRVKGIVEAWLGGQAGGGAIADVLTGRVNPSGKLAETFPATLEQTPTFPNFPGHSGHAHYGEGVFIGYRYYDAKRLTPLFPFGFGLSYTEFAYAGIRSSAAAFDVDHDGPVTIEVTVKNTGSVSGREVVQLYVHERAPALPRPPVELRAFDKVALEAGEEKTIRFTLSRRDFAHYEADTRSWAVTSGSFDIRVGGSSRELPLQVSIDVTATPVGKKHLTRRSLVRDFKGVANDNALYDEMVRAMGFGELLDSASRPEARDLSPEQVVAIRKSRMSTFAFVDEIPVNKVPAFSHGKFSEDRLEEILQAAGNIGN
jgi:beta-glucosidase